MTGSSQSSDPTPPIDTASPIGTASPLANCRPAVRTCAFIAPQSASMFVMASGWSRYPFVDWGIAAPAAVAALADAMRAVARAARWRVPSDAVDDAVAAAVAIVAARTGSPRIGDELRAAAERSVGPAAAMAWREIAECERAAPAGLDEATALRVAAALGGARAAASAAASLRAGRGELAAACATALLVPPKCAAARFATEALAGLAPLIGPGPLELGWLPAHCVASAAAYFAAVDRFRRGGAPAGDESEALATFASDSAPAADFAAGRLRRRGFALFDPLLGDADREFLGDDMARWISTADPAMRPPFYGEIMATGIRPATPCTTQCTAQIAHDAHDAHDVQPASRPAAAFPAPLDPRLVDSTPGATPEAAWLDSWNGFDLKVELRAEIAARELAAELAAERDREAAARDREAAARDREAAARDCEAAERDREAAARDREVAARDMWLGGRHSVDNAWCGPRLLNNRIRARARCADPDFSSTSESGSEPGSVSNSVSELDHDPTHIYGNKFASTNSDYEKIWDACSQALGR